MSDNSSSSGGVGVLGLLGVAFVVLKLTGVIDWSWWWVTLPFWGGLALVVAGFIVYVIVKVIASKVSKRRFEKKLKSMDVDDVKPLRSGFQERLQDALRRQRIKNILKNK